MRFARFAWGVLAANLLVIVWGAFVRASGSGAGCGDHWPLCNGEVVPHAPSIATAIELTHRTTSGLALLAVLGMLVASRRVFPQGHAARKAAGASMIFMLLEAAVGAVLVLLRLTGDDTSITRAVVIGLHLVNTFLLVGALTMTALSAQVAPQPLRASGLGRASLAGAVLLVLVGAAGAITALGDTLFPSASLAAGLEADLSETAHLLVRLRVVHPALAVLTALYLFGLATAAAAARPELRLRASLLTASIAVQMALGLLDLALLAPTWLQLLHLFVADVVWIAHVAFAVQVLGAVAPAPPAATEIAAT